VNKIAIGLTYLGGCLLPALFFAPQLWTKRELASGGLIAVMVAGSIAWANQRGHEYGLLLQLQMAVMVAIGIQLVGLALTQLWRRRDTVSLMLAIWLGSGFVFAAVLNWTVSARTFLPLVPVAAILIVRGLTRKAATASQPKTFFWPVAAAFAISLMIGAADYSLASSGREAAQELATKYPPGQGRLWFQGHCGFQYYLQKAGGTAVDFSQSVLPSGELMIVPANNSNLITPDPGDVEIIESPVFPTWTWLNTVSARTGAGFYGAGGLLPYVFGPTPAEQYFVCRASRLMDPLYFANHSLETSLVPPEVMNNLAWQLATSPDPKNRDGNEAVRLAERACKLTGYRETVMVGTLGAAYAEAGRFDEAIVTAEKACALATAANKPELLKINQQLLELYRQHLPFHEANKPE
jgi:hypothetical protein